MNPIWLGLGAVTYLIVLNALAWHLFFVDKQRAVQREWRISERTLLTVALLGGSLGAKLAQRRLRHKTRKQPFAASLNLILVLQSLAIGIAASPDLREFVMFALHKALDA